MSEGFIKVVVNGNYLNAEKGANLLEFLERNGFYIPALCSHPKLTKTGACRLCIVKVNGKLTTSCTFTIENDIEVITDDEEINFLRRGILQLLDDELDADCGHCVLEGLCELKKIADKYNVKLTPTALKRDEDTSSPVLDFNPNKCIKCFRCIKACDEIQGKGVLNFSSRGDRIQLTLGYSKWGESECDGCGECVQVCPTAALTEKSLNNFKKILPYKKLKTTCIYCGVGCQLEVWVKNGKIAKVEGAYETPNYGSLCVKGRFGIDGIISNDRLKKPLIKKNGTFKEVSWNEALNFTSKRLLEIKNKYGSDAIFGLSSAKCTNEENYIFQKFIRAAIGTNNIDHCARLCHASTVAGLMMAFGSGAMTNSIEELEYSDVILITGSNTTESHPVIATYIKRAVKYHDSKLIVVDPRQIDITRYAMLHLKQRNGTDVAWLNGMMHVILKEGLEDREFIKKRTEGFESFKEVVEDYTPERVEKITGIRKEDLIEAARIFGRAKNASIVFAMGITQHITGTDNVLSIANLAMLTGNVGKAFSGVNPLRGQNNVQGAGDVGALPNVYPGYQPVEDPKVKEKFERFYGVKLSSKKGLTLTEMINEIFSGKIKAVYVMGENPLLSEPNINHVKEALEKVDFMVVEDIYLSETAQLADVVLPACSFLEKDGTFTNTERRILPVKKIFDPIGESKPDWKIICEISNRMGYKMNYNDVSEIMSEISEVSEIYRGVNYSRLQEKLQWPVRDKQHKGTKFLHKDRFTRGLGKFHPVDYIPSAELPDDEYPFLLSTGRILYHYHTGTISRRSQYLTSFINEPYVEINPVDAAKCNIKNHEYVKISTRRGSIILKALLSERVIEGSLFIPFHFKEAAANVLTNDALDPIAKIPEFKVSAAKCRIERL